MKTTRRELFGMVLAAPVATVAAAVAAALPPSAQAETIHFAETVSLSEDRFMHFHPKYYNATISIETVFLTDSQKKVLAELVVEIGRICSSMNAKWSDNLCRSLFEDGWSHATEPSLSSI